MNDSRNERRQSAHAHDRAGMQYAELGDLQRASTSFTLAIEQSPLLAKLWRNRGFVRLLQGMVDEALHDIARALELDSSDSLAHHHQALALIKAQQYESAEDACTVALSLPSPCWMAQRTRAALRLYRGEFSLAEVDYTAAIAMDPLWSDGWTGLAMTHLCLEEYSKAISCLSQCLSIDRDCRDAYLIRAQTHRLLGHINNAMDDFENALLIDSECLLAQRGHQECVDVLLGTGQSSAIV